MDIIKKDIRDDIKIVLEFSHPPQDSTFVISLFSLSEYKDTKGAITKKKTSVWNDAIWDGETAHNIQFLADNKVLVTFNYADVVTDKTKWDKGWFLVGRLHGTIYISYPDSEMPDKVYDKMECIDIPIEIINKDYCNG